MKLTALATLCVVTAGCATAPPPTKNRVSDLVCEASEWVPYDAVGTGVIEGQAFLKTRGGDVKLGAGNAVELVPSAPTCARNWWVMAGQFWKSRYAHPLDPSFMTHVRKVTADAGGKFRFDKLPAGTYYVRTVVTWEVPTAYSSNVQGGLVGGEFTVKEGETTQAILTWGTPGQINQ